MAQRQTRAGGGGGDDEAVGGGPAGQEQRAAMAADTDDLLDEIDDVLEQNSESFGHGFVQKGGQ